MTNIFSISEPNLENKTVLKMVWLDFLDDACRFSFCGKKSSFIPITMLVLWYRIGIFLTAFVEGRSFVCILHLYRYSIKLKLWHISRYIYNKYFLSVDNKQKLIRCLPQYTPFCTKICSFYIPRKLTSIFLIS